MSYEKEKNTIVLKRAKKYILEKKQSTKPNTEPKYI